MGQNRGMTPIFYEMTKSKKETRICLKKKELEKSNNVVS